MILLLVRMLIMTKRIYIEKIIVRLYNLENQNQPIMNQYGQNFGMRLMPSFFPQNNMHYNPNFNYMKPNNDFNVYKDNIYFNEYYQNSLGKHFSRK